MEPRYIYRVDNTYLPPQSNLRKWISSPPSQSPACPVRMAGHRMPPHCEWWVLGWPIRCLAVSCHAALRTSSCGKPAIFLNSLVIPGNCCMCTARGSGCVALGGGDYDGGFFDILILPPFDTVAMACLNSKSHGRKSKGLLIKNQKDPVPLRSVMQ